MKILCSIVLSFVVGSVASADLATIDQTAIFNLLNDISTRGKSLPKKIEILNRFKKTFEASVGATKIPRTFNQRTNAYHFLSAVFLEAELNVEMFSTQENCDRRLNALNAAFEMPGLTQADLDGTEVYRLSRQVLADLCSGYQD